MTMMTSQNMAAINLDSHAAMENEVNLRIHLTET